MTTIKKEQIYLSEDSTCQLCMLTPPKHATRIARNEINGLLRRVCDSCFSEWSSKCKLTVVLEAPAKVEVVAPIPAAL